MNYKGREHEQQAAHLCRTAGGPISKPILYAENDDNDVALMEYAFERLGIARPLRVVVNGKEAMAYLAGQEPFANREANPLPCLTLLDVSMPARTGLDVLKWMKSEPSLIGLPVVLFSSSSQERDIRRASALNADGYLVKPGDPDDLLCMVRDLQRYCLGLERAKTLPSLWREERMRLE
jgi:CheY-like chemotaxis protein